MSHQTPESVSAFWFQELEPRDWWVGGTHIDTMIADRFGATVESALKGELYTWRTTPEGRLAEIICLDQFTRNIFRGTARAFSGDGTALILCQEAILGAHDLALPQSHRSFLYMPLMHSESLMMHDLAAEKLSGEGFEMTLKSLKEHTAVLAEFGRYPSRNKALGRTSTPAERLYLENGTTWGQS